MPTSVIIRPGRPEEAPALAALVVRSWQHAYRGLLPDAVLDGLRPVERLERWRSRLAGQGDRSQVWVAERDRAPIGVAWFGAAGGHPIAPPPCRSGEIFAFYLEPSWFGVGVGHALATGVEAWLGARFERSVLWVLEENVRARSFYSRRGWSPDGRRVPYPRPGCRGVTMVRHRWEARDGGPGPDPGVPPRSPCT